MSYLSLKESLDILNKYKLPLVKYYSKIEEVKKYPVVLKVSSKNILHKSDVGGVILNIKDYETLKKEYFKLKNKFPNADIIIQEMISEHNKLEIIVSVKKDDIFGYFVLIGLGGIFVEIFKDYIILIDPFTEEEFSKNLNFLKAKKLLEGYRGYPKVDLNKLYILLKELLKIIKIENLEEIELNPVIITENNIYIVDARIKK